MLAFTEASSEGIPSNFQQSRFSSRNTQRYFEIIHKDIYDKKNYVFQKKRQATQDSHKDIVMLCRDKIRRAKANLEFSLATAREDNKNTSAAGMLMRISILSQIWGETQSQRMQKSLRYLMPSLPQSLLVRPVVFWYQPRVGRQG